MTTVDKNKQAVDTCDDTERTEKMDGDVDVENNALALEKDIDMTSTLVVVDDNTDAIPTLFDIFIHFNGSLSFAVGSAGFISSTYFENRLPYIRYGSFFWSYGCIMYSVPLFMKFRNRSSNNSYCCPWGIGDVGAFLCYTFFIIGCILAGFFNEEKVLEYYPVINHMFVYGSFSLTLEPFYQVILFLTRGGNCRSRMGESKLCGSGGSTTNNDNDNDNDNVESSVQVAPPLKLQWDRLLELFAIASFCSAGVFGGFHPHHNAALAGLYFTEVGSLFCLARSFLLVYERRVGLKAMQKDSAHPYNKIITKLIIKPVIIIARVA
jgi:hypothetical protein